MDAQIIARIFCNHGINLNTTADVVDKDAAIPLPNVRVSFKSKLANTSREYTRLGEKIHHERRQRSRITR